MVSCKSCKLCKERCKCSCRQANQPFTDFCGCSEYCENTDNTMPVNIMEDDDELVEVFYIFYIERKSGCGNNITVY